MRWQVEENRALEQFQSNVAFEQREKLLEAAEQSEGGGYSSFMGGLLTTLRTEL